MTAITLSIAATMPATSRAMDALEAGFGLKVVSMANPFSVLEAQIAAKSLTARCVRLMGATA